MSALHKQALCLQSEKLLLAGRLSMAENKIKTLEKSVGIMKSQSAQEGAAVDFGESADTSAGIKEEQTNLV